MKKYRNGKFSGIPALIFWTAVWWIGAKLFRNPLLLPTPWQVLTCLTELAVTAGFWQTVAMSIGRILLGVAGSIALGVALAALTTNIRLADVLIAPAMTAMQATPVASITILLLIWLDRNWVPVLICVMMVLPVVWNTISLFQGGGIYGGYTLASNIIAGWIPMVLAFVSGSIIAAIAARREKKGLYVAPYISWDDAKED